MCYPPGMMTFDAAVERALQEPTLVEALTWIAVWDCDRAVRQALRTQGPAFQSGLVDRLMAVDSMMKSSKKPIF